MDDVRNLPIFESIDNLEAFLISRKMLNLRDSPVFNPAIGKNNLCHIRQGSDIGEK
jgi:hypothetical protein